MSEGAATAGASGQRGGGVLLEVEHLGVRLRSGERVHHAVVDASFSIAAGARVGMVGESGSGKSVSALSILRLYDPRLVQYAPGSRVFFEDFEGAKMLALSRRAPRELRRSRISMVFQERMSVLNPVLKIGWQIEHFVRTHGRVDRGAAAQETRHALSLVHLPDPERVMASFPHQLSGGMLQRVLIAMAIACRPGLLFADEPTSALDVTVRAGVLRTFRELVDELEMALLLISHDIGVIGETCDYVYVMYGGRLIESGPTEAALAPLRRPYTHFLLRYQPRPDGEVPERLPTIPGMQGSRLVGAEAIGSSFSPPFPIQRRGVQAQRARSRVRRRGVTGAVACHRWRELASASRCGRARDEASRRPRSPRRLLPATTKGKGRGSAHRGDRDLERACVGRVRVAQRLVRGGGDPGQCRRVPRPVLPFLAVPARGRIDDERLADGGWRDAGDEDLQRGCGVIVDVHAHCLKPEHWGCEFNDHWKSTYGYDYPDLSPAEFDAAMWSGDVEVAILFGLRASAVGVGTPHEFLARFCSEATTPTVGFMSLDPLDADVMDQVEEGIALGLQGVKLDPVLAGFSPIDEALRPFFDLLERRGLVVLWHMGGSPSPKSTLRFSQPLLIDDVAHRHPELRQIIAHMGHPWQRDTVQVLRSNEHVYSDVSGLWARSFDGFLALTNAIEWGVADKLLFGSDIPLWTPADAKKGLRDLAGRFGPPFPPIDKSVIEGIIQRDACALLGVEPW